MVVMVTVMARISYSCSDLTVLVQCQHTEAFSKKVTNAFTQTYFSPRSFLLISLCVNCWLRAGSWTDSGERWRLCICH